MTSVRGTVCETFVWAAGARAKRTWLSVADETASARAIDSIDVPYAEAACLVASRALRAELRGAGAELVNTSVAKGK